MARSLRLVVFAILSIAVVVGGTAADSIDTAQAPDDAPIVVIDVGGPIDQRTIDFVVSTIQAHDAHAYVLEIDSPGASSGDISPLLDALASAPAPVIAWVGPYPAVAYGAAALLANHADVRSAAPGTSVGFLVPVVRRGDEQPVVLRTDDDPLAVETTASQLASTATEVGPSTIIAGFVDRVDPALGQLLASLDGVEVERNGTTMTLDTATVEVVDGVEVSVLDRSVTFMKSGFLDRFLRLASKPESAFLFLVFGLAFAIFEFYAAGTGLMAFVASLSLILSGYGMATLPMWWPAVALVVGGSMLQVWGFSRNRVDWRSVLGTVLILIGGLTFSATRPQYPPSPWMVVLATAAGAVFVWYSLTSVVRGRFATPTFGREELLGKRCLVVSTLDPVGVVVVDGARWQATADRGIEISAGAPAAIVGVTGLLLEVDPLGPADMAG